MSTGADVRNGLSIDVRTPSKFNLLEIKGVYGSDINALSAKTDFFKETFGNNSSTNTSVRFELGDGAISGPSFINELDVITNKFGRIETKLGLRENGFAADTRDAVNVKTQLTQYKAFGLTFNLNYALEVRN